MRSFHFALLALPLMAACATTPLGKCEAPHRAELSTVNREIEDTARTLRRGFRLVPARFKESMNYCESPSGALRLCRGEEDEPMYDKRGINRAAETAKLEALQAEKARLEAALATCRATYPE